MVGKSMPIAKFNQWVCSARGMAAALFSALAVLLAVMTHPGEAQVGQPAGQRPLAVVSVSCGSDLALCRALIQVLAETAPSQIYRINPKPRPAKAFDLRINQNRQGQAQLVWSGGKGAGEKVARAGMSDLELSRALLKVSPGLPRALRDHQARSI